MKLFIPAQHAEDLKPLLEILERSFELLQWSDEQLPEPEEGPVLVDLRGETDFGPGLLGQQEQCAPPPLLLVVDGSCRLSGIDELVVSRCPWMPISLELAPEQTAALVEAKARAWKARAAAAEQDTQQAEARAEEQSIELMVKNSELSRLAAFKAGVIARLGDAERGYVADIIKQVAVLDKQPDLTAELRAVQNALHHTAASIQHIFRSFDYWEKAERELEARTVLICVSTRKTRKLLVRSFAETKATIHGAATADEGLQILRDGVDLLYVDWPNADLIKQAPAICPDARCVLLTGELLFEDFGSRMLELPLQNVLITSDVALSDRDEAPPFLRELSVTAGKLLGDNIFGIEKYLSWGTKVNEVLVTNSDQRFDVLDEISEFAPRAGLRPSMCQNLETLADELLMNAIWDAPVDDTGYHKYSALSRRRAIDLLPHECPVLRYGADSRMVAVSVTDPFGGLERDLAYDYLVKCFARSDDQIDSKMGGAGLGLYTAFLSVSTLVINVAPGLRTEVIGLLDKKLSRRKLSGLARSYHYFTTR